MMTTSRRSLLPLQSSLKNNLSHTHILGFGGWASALYLPRPKCALHRQNTGRGHRPCPPSCGWPAKAQTFDELNAGCFKRLGPRILMAPHQQGQLAMTARARAASPVLTWRVAVSVRWYRNISAPRSTMQRAYCGGCPSKTGPWRVLSASAKQALR